MPHMFGGDPRLDGRWLTLLNPQICPADLQRQLFRQGYTPDAVLAQTHDGAAQAVWDALRVRVERAPAVTIRNAIDPEQPIYLVPQGDRAYPPLLAQCNDAPPALFVVGNVAVLSDPTLAIVGARRASPLGLELAASFAQSLADAGLVIASGLALGIDGAAHRGTLASGGEGIAVLPTGIDTVYPRRHQQLVRQLAHRGVVVSEFLPGSQPRKGHFHRRNRTLSGLSLGTLVVEAGRPSGSLITAGAAAQQGREVFAMPWSLRHPGGQGCLHLLSDGATLVQTPQDILLSIAPGLAAFGVVSLSPARSLPQSARLMLDALGDETLSVDTLAFRLGMSAPLALRRLTELELAGWVQRQQGMWRQSGA